MGLRRRSDQGICLFFIFFFVRVGVAQRRGEQGEGGREREDVLFFAVFLDLVEGWGGRAVLGV